MLLYDKDGIVVSTIVEEDKDRVLQYFSENTFNCDGESGALRPTNSQFMQIMDGIIFGCDDENNILVLKKDNEVIGYESMFVEYDRLVIGHIAIDRRHRNNGYGELLTRLAIQIAENEDRDVTLYCNYKNSFLIRLGFKQIDSTHYIRRRQGIKEQSLPRLFVSVAEYRKRVEERIQKESKRFVWFLRDNAMEI